MTDYGTPKAGFLEDTRRGQGKGDNHTLDGGNGIRVIKYFNYPWVAPLKAQLTLHLLPAYHIDAMI